MFIEALISNIVCNQNICNKSVEAFNKQTGLEKTEQIQKDNIKQKLGKTRLSILGASYSTYRLITNKEVKLNFDGNKKLNFTKDKIKVEVKWEF